MHRFLTWKRWRDSVLSQRQTAPAISKFRPVIFLPAHQTRREILITFRRALHLEMMRDRDNGIARRAKWPFFRQKNESSAGTK
jgi:hypothetical protein